MATGITKNWGSGGMDQMAVGPIGEDDEMSKGVMHRIWRYYRRSIG